MEAGKKDDVTSDRSPVNVDTKHLCINPIWNIIRFDSYSHKRLHKHRRGAAESFTQHREEEHLCLEPHLCPG